MKQILDEDEPREVPAPPAPLFDIISLGNPLAQLSKLHHPPTKVSRTLANTPLKINTEHIHGGLEDHFPF